MVVGLASAGRKKPKGNRSWGESENAQNCLISDPSDDGVTTISTVEGDELSLGEIATKCYHEFNCDNANVMVKFNAWNFKLDQFCQGNHVKLEYRVYRDDFQDYHNVQDQYDGCGEPTLGVWTELSDQVFWSFVHTDVEYYDWFYGYTDYGLVPETASKFEIEFKCGEENEPTVEPTTTEPPTTINPEFDSHDQKAEDWDEMLEHSDFNEKGRKRISRNFRKYQNQLNKRHNKLIAREPGCSFSQMTSSDNKFGQQHVDLTDTCTSIGQQLQDLTHWGEDYVKDCESSDAKLIQRNNQWFNRFERRIGKFENNLFRLHNC